MSFSFSFSGEDIDVDTDGDGEQQQEKKPIAIAAASSSSSSSAFPVAGKPLLPAASHDLKQMLSELPSKVAYGVLDVDLGGSSSNGNGNGDEEKVGKRSRIRLPRRELWDVRVQLMAEAEDDNNGEPGPGLGNHDVRTGIYEGGFKSWESSVDLVKVLRQSSRALLSPAGEGGYGSTRIIEVRGILPLRKSCNFFLPR